MSSLEPGDLTDSQKAVLLTISKLPPSHRKDRRYFEKILFLLVKAQPQILEEIELTFEGYKMGPYSEYVDELNQNLEDFGLAKRLELTPSGRSLAPQLEAEAALNPVVQSLNDTLEVTKEFDVNDLLCFVYRLYPEFARESEFPTEARSQRLEHFSVPVGKVPEGSSITVTSDKGTSINVRRKDGRLVVTAVN
jgi:hypothetical protein